MLFKEGLGNYKSSTNLAVAEGAGVLYKSLGGVVPLRRQFHNCLSCVYNCHDQSCLHSGSHVKEEN